jgi:hypothetical protein
MGRPWICLVTISLLTPAPRADAQSVSLTAVEDSWIQGLTGTTTHGSDLQLIVCPKCYEWTYLKFDLAEVQGVVSSAELRLTRLSGARPEEISLYFITDDTWNEGSLTGPARPAPQMPLPEESLASGVAGDGHDRWASDALLQVVRAQESGDGILSLMLREDYNSVVDPRSYSSREGAASREQAPRLVLTMEGPPAVLRRGDANGDGELDISDAVFLLWYLFVDGRTPGCGDAADATDDGTLDISDPIAILGQLYLGQEPAGGFLGICGPDLTEDSLDCNSAGPCA